MRKLFNNYVNASNEPQVSKAVVPCEFITDV